MNISLPMNILPIDRALSIYGVLADRSETKGARKQLSRHLMELYIGGEKDQHRLTMHGLSYLRDLDGQSIPATEQATCRPGLALLRLTLLPQGIAPHNSRIRDTGCVRPCLLCFRKRRPLLPAVRGHHSQLGCSNRAVLDRLHAHWAGGW